MVAILWGSQTLRSAYFRIPRTVSCPSLVTWSLFCLPSLLFPPNLPSLCFLDVNRYLVCMPMSVHIRFLWSAFLPRQSLLHIMCTITKADRVKRHCNGSWSGNGAEKKFTETRHSQLVKKKEAAAAAVAAPPPPPGPIVIQVRVLPRSGFVIFLSFSCNRQHRACTGTQT